MESCICRVRAGAGTFRVAFAVPCMSCRLLSRRVCCTVYVVSPRLRCPTPTPYYFVAVNVNSSSSTNTTVVALSTATGSVNWSSFMSDVGSLAAAPPLFAPATTGSYPLIVSLTTTVFGLNLQQSGYQTWSTKLPGGVSTVSAVSVSSNNVAYVTAAASGGQAGVAAPLTLFGLDAGSGSVKLTQQFGAALPGAGFAPLPPVVTFTGLVVPTGGWVFAVAAL